MRLFLSLMLLMSPAGALAGNDVSLASQVFVERDQVDAAGKHSVVLAPPEMVTPGDKLLFVLSYRNVGPQPATELVVTNPVPPAVAYSTAEGDGLAVSADGGSTWGALSSLKVKQADGTLRPAAPQDVTHVRWTFTRPIAAGANGKLAFRGIVR